MIHAEIHIGKESNSVGSQISPFANSDEAETINAVYVETIHASALYSGSFYVDNIVDDINTGNSFKNQICIDRK